MIIQCPFSLTWLWTARIAACSPLVARVISRGCCVQLGDDINDRVCA